MDSNSKENILEVVDENGGVVGEDTRHNIHMNGLLHKEVHVWFYTPDGQVIFQHRAKDKETFPDLLDATAGGHVEKGTDYLTSALDEIKEETGIDVNPSKLTSLGTVAQKAFDKVTGMTNNVVRGVYAFCYKGSINDLKVEQGAGAGFELWPIDRLFNLTDSEKKKFIPAMIEPLNLELFQKIKSLLNNE